MPSDDVSVFYKTSGELVRVLVEFSEHIQNSTKSPVIAGQPPASSDIIINEKTKVCHYPDVVAISGAACSYCSAVMFHINPFSPFHLCTL